MELSPPEFEPASAALARPSLAHAAWDGSRKWGRFIAYITLPFAYLGVVVFLAIAAFALGIGRRLHLAWPALGLVGFAVTSILWAMIFGAMFGLVGGVIRRARLGQSWSVINHPLRLFRRRSNGLSGEGRAKPRRGRSWAYLVAGPLLAVVMVALGVGTYARWFASRRLADAIVAADRDDPSWRIEGLMAAREPVPDDENGAIVVADVVSLLPEDWPSLPANSAGSMPEPTEATRAFDRMNETAFNRRLDDATANTLRTELADLSDAVALARTMAKYDRGRHELSLGPMLLDTPLPETQASRVVSRLLLADAAILAQDGDSDAAFASGRAILGVGRSIGDEPFLISHLVRINIGLLAARSFQRTLGQGEPSEPALADAQRLLLDEMDQPLLRHGLEGERAVQGELLRRVAEEEMPVAALSGGGQPIGRVAPDPKLAPWGRSWYDNQRAVALEWTTEAIRITHRPAVERPRLWTAWEAEIDRVHRSRITKFLAVIPLLASPAMTASVEAHRRYQGGLGSMAVMIASERHRRKYGEWPTSIEAIDRAILPVPPIDPFTGKTLRLDRRDGRFVVYSVGPNLRDEKGIFEPKRSMQGGPDDYGITAWDVPLRRRPAEE